MTTTATFGAGCFWGVEAAFRRLDGVTATAVGYMGGALDDPSYKDVCTDRTGHAEVLQVHYDPDRVSYEDLLEVFWSRHDPTTMNRQGPARRRAGWAPGGRCPRSGTIERSSLRVIQRFPLPRVPTPPPLPALPSTRQHDRRPRSARGR